MKKLYDEYIKQKAVIDNLVKKFEDGEQTYESRKKLICLRDIQLELAEKITELKKYVLE